jgi:protoporphyrinogen oxidase
MNEEVLILGAGPAGMAAAFELYRAGKSFLVIEKNERVGGLARTFQYGEFRTDTGPHRFFSQNQYLYDFIEDLLGESWIKVDRLTRFYINDKFFLYPVQLKNALLNVGFSGAFRILFDYLSQRVKKIFVNKDLVSFEEQVVSDFGRALAELNMLNYTEKIWGLPCSEISPDWSKQRIKGLSLKEVIKKAIIKSKAGPKTLVDQFYYPDLGTGLIYERIKERILAYAGGGSQIK